MSSGESKWKKSFRILIPTVLLILILVTFLETSSISILRDNEEVRDLKNQNINLENLPNILIGTSSGEIYSTKQDSEIAFFGSVKDDIQHIEKSKGDIIVATIQNNVQKEESGNSNGMITRIKREKEGEGFLSQFTDKEKFKKEIGGQLLDVDMTKDKILVASHNHDSRKQKKGEKFYKGKISVLNRENLEIRKEIQLPGASDIKVYNDNILVYGVGPTAKILDKNNLTVRNKIEIRGVIAGADIQNEKIFLSSRRDLNKVDIPENSDITHGYISKHVKSGKEISKIDLGITSLPREMTAYKNNSLIVTDFGEKKIKFINFNKNKIMKSIQLNDRPENLIISEDKAYTIGSEKDLLYVIDLNSKKLKEKIKVPGINSISTY